MQFGECVDNLLFGLSRHVDDRRRVGLVSQVAINRVMAKIGAAPDEPLGERQI